MNYHKNLNQTLTSGFKPGDVLLLNFSGAKHEATHIGIIQKVNSDGTLQTIEGNTSLTSDDNGGAVMVRTRYPQHFVCAIRPGYDPEQDNVQNDDENKVNEGAEKEMTLEEITSINATGNTHDSWADEAVNALVSAGIFNGDGNGNYGWEKPLTRQAAAQIIYNLLKKLELEDKLK